MAATAAAHVPHDVVYDIAPSPGFSRDGTIFAIVRQTLFRSGDGGHEWRRVTWGLGVKTIKAVAVSPAFERDRTVLAGSADGIFRSTDAGHRFERVLADVDVGRLLLSPRFDADRTAMALTTTGNLIVSHDAGDSWTDVLGNSRRATSANWSGDVLAIGTGGGDVLTSDDAGDTWTSCGTHPRHAPISAIALRRTSSSDRVFHVATQTAGVARVDCERATIEPLEQDFPGAHVTALADLTTEEGSILLATTWTEAAYRSTDRGKSWTHQARGLNKHRQADEPFYAKPHFNVLAAADDGTVFLGGFTGVYASRDGGLTWDEIETLPVSIIVGLDVSPAVGSDFRVAVATYGGGAYSKLDSEGHWRIDNYGTWSTRFAAVRYSPDFARDHTVFASTFGGILRSDTADGRWEILPIQTPTFPERAYAWLTGDWRARFRRNARRVVKRVGGEDWSIYRTIDDWLAPVAKPEEESTKIEDTEFEFAVALAPSPDFAVDRTVFAGRYPFGILRSTDGGHAFRLVWDAHGSEILSLEVSPTFSEDRTLFTALDSGVYRSLDAGLTWEPAGPDVGFTLCQLALSPGFLRDQTLYAGTDVGLFVSRDGGDTWVPVDITGNPRAAIGAVAVSPDFVSDRLLLVQPRGADLYVCHDRRDALACATSDSARRGNEFSQLRGFGRDRLPLIRFSPSFRDDGIVYAAAADRLMRSTDRGLTWAEVPKPIRYESDWPVVRLEGDWTLRPDLEFSGGSVAEAASPGASASLRFVGTGVSIAGAPPNKALVALVTLDGRAAGSIDGADGARVTSGGAALFSAPALAYGPHTVTIEVRDASSASGETGETTPDGDIGTIGLLLDAFDVTR